MKRKVMTCICILLAVVLLIPIPVYFKDGGTVVYTAVLYRVHHVHELNWQYDGKNAEYLEGTIVEILGFEVFNNVH